MKRVELVAGRGGLPALKIATPWSTAEIYLHGAHVTHFQKLGEPPLLWMSQESLFTAGKAIRGGIPICFPWFGPREGKPAHGFARIVEWELIETRTSADGSVSTRLRLPEKICTENSFSGRAELAVKVNQMLMLELTVFNPSAATLNFENCLHSYFTVSDISAISISGLEGAEYVDKMDGGKQKRETSEVIRIMEEVDRAYLDTHSPVEILDAKSRRAIRVDKSGAASTVVWNPWIAKSKAMPDFGDEEFHGMVCVESGNVAKNIITLRPGESATLQVCLSSRAI